MRSRVEFGFAMIRPDSLELGLDEPIIERLEESGISVAKRSIHVMDEADVDSLYPYLHDRSFYPSMKAGMVGRRVMSLIMVGGPGIAERLKTAKGRVSEPSGSIRADYSGGHLLTGALYERFLRGILSEADKKTPEWRDVMRNDRVHSDESPEETANSIRVMFPGYDILEVAERFPELASFLAEN
jgi:nucleoside diphosphate kinase